MTPVRCAVDVALRAASPADRPLLRALLPAASTHDGEAQIAMVLADGEAVGAVVYDRSPGRVHLVDLVVMPTQRGRGIASSALRLLIGPGTIATATVRADDRRALALCERHGFTVVAEHVGRLLLATGVDD
ncbi:GNAT family N-acetyltransferase [Leifsonia sp. AG29]|uniref:GNAT family N-acetyltransferase n=1 Tax=Leifsonia sp. AG29 TaxID=2598860 RepID=UPI00131CEE3A|nr:GNAT family N-acetyltransferase [Leifsonia sp. AG29]